MKVKFVLSRGEDIYIEKERAQAILASDKQIVLIMDENGEWTGKALNKAHIVAVIPYESEEYKPKVHVFNTPPSPTRTEYREKILPDGRWMMEEHIVKNDETALIKPETAL